MVSGAVVVNLTTPNARRGAVFDGVDDDVDLTNDDSFNFNQNFTISFWVFANSVNQGDVMVAKDNGTADTQFTIVQAASNARIDFRVSVASGNKVTNAANDTTIARVWEHWTARYDGIEIQLFKNGVATGTAVAATGTLDVIADKCFIGRRTNGKFFDGVISDVKFWNRALSQSEITNVVAEKDVTDGLVHRYKLDTDYTDSAGSLNGTNTGSRLTARDDLLATAISGARVTASDKYMIANSGDDILSVVIEEAP